MVEKFFLWSLAFLSLVGWGALGVLIARATPETLVARFLFFGILFLSVLLAASSLAYYLSLRASQSNRRERRLRSSLLLGIAPAAAVISAMWLQSLRALGLASGLVILGAMLVLELIFYASGRRNIDVRRIEETSD